LTSISLSSSMIGMSISAAGWADFFLRRIWPPGSGHSFARRQIWRNVLVPAGTLGNSRHFHLSFSGPVACFRRQFRCGSVSGRTHLANRGFAGGLPPKPGNLFSNIARRSRQAGRTSRYCEIRFFAGADWRFYRCKNGRWPIRRWLPAGRWALPVLPGRALAFR